MTIQERLLEAVEQKLLRPIDAQFALTVAGNDESRRDAGGSAA